MSFDRREIQRSFGRAADDYEQHAWLQREVRARLFERLEEMPLEPQRIVDLGSGSGAGSAELKQRYRHAEVIGIDLAHAMCRQTIRQSRWRRPVNAVQADAAGIPLASNSVELVIANLALQWLTDLPAVLNGVRRILRPDGVFLFSTFGPDTLMELREAWAEVDDQPRVSRFIDQHVIGDLLLSSGFRDPVMDCDRITATYPDVNKLMRDLKNIGAHNASSDRPRGLTGKHKLAAMRQAYEAFRDDRSGQLPATWEVVYGTAWGPQEGQPVRNPEGGETAAFSLDALRGSMQRKPEKQ